jgi:hypothetical protein
VCVLCVCGPDLTYERAPRPRTSKTFCRIRISVQKYVVRPELQFFRDSFQKFLCKFSETSRTHSPVSQEGRPVFGITLTDHLASISRGSRVLGTQQERCPLFDPSVVTGGKNRPGHTHLPLFSSHSSFTLLPILAIKSFQVGKIRESFLLSQMYCLLHLLRSHPKFTSSKFLW